MDKPRAKLEDWSIGSYEGKQVLFGFCTEHPTKPHLEGHRVRTSEILKMVLGKHESFAETKNTIYELGARSEWRANAA